MRMWNRSRKSLVVLTACFGSIGCSSSSDITADDRAAWRRWSSDFVSAECNREMACGSNDGAACPETGQAAADKASCDAAVSFYLANRDKLEACIDPYPSSCDITADQACPELSGNHSFESLCP